MSAATDASTDVELDELTDNRSLWEKTKTLSKKNPLGAFGLVVVIVMVFMALFADVITWHDPVDISFEDMLVVPSWEFLLGTDQLGRDIFSRIVYGARTALLVGITASVVGAFIGLVLGVASAYFGGTFDLLFQRFMDVFMAFPLIILALAIVSIFGGGVDKVILAITIPFIPRCARVVRSNALAIREIPYVDAARAMGFSHTRIILRHMVPNVMAPFLIMITAFVGQAILTEASLSYLGMGVQEPTPAWGLMLQGGAEEYAESAPWVPIFPGVAITLAVFGFNLFGDAVRDTLDPRLRSQ
ncbi:MAG: ABC transporter permease [Rhodospirillaceae bacterium]|nr:ABC transporter permease [Rhodospirillaceae bacterium]